MLKFGIAAEAPADVRVVTGLADRIIVAQVDWVTPVVLDDYRQWCGQEGTGWLDVHHALAQAKASGLAVYGRFGDDPGMEDAQMVRAILMLFADMADVSLVVVARDVDGRPWRVEGFEQARAAAMWPFEVVLAAPQPAQEAWLLAGFAADSEEETTTLTELRQHLGFDPTIHPGRLKPGRETSKKNCKRVLKQLCNSPLDAEERFFSRPLEQLERHGEDSGLSEFIAIIQPVVRRLFGVSND